MSYRESVHAKAVELSRMVVEMTAEAGSGHPSSATSLAHLVTVLLYDHMRFDPAEPDHPAADRLVLSEGHAVPILYAAAADLGMAFGVDDPRRLTPQETRRLRAVDSELDGHPNPAEGFPFFPAATGSLGQGLSVALGLAMAAGPRAAHERVFCIVGDGESREGQVWEALDMLVERGLNAVLPIFNCNQLSQTGTVSGRQRAEALVDKLRGFGLDPLVIDGHDGAQIRAAFDRHEERCEEGADRPLALVARTVKGWGTPTLQGEGHHGDPVEGERASRALAELEETARALGAVWSEGDLQRPSLDPRPRVRGAVPGAPPVPGLSEALRALDREDGLASGMATREAFGLALRFLARARPDLVVLDGDVGDSTHTDSLLDDPDLTDRLVQCHIAEQNMVSVAAGLCAGGMRPVACTFGKFLARTYDQIEMALLSGFPMRIVGSHVGVSAAADGPSQMALADVGWFHALGRVESRSGAGPLVHTVTPCDARSAYALTRAMVEHDGATYLRTIRPRLPTIYDEDATFELGGHRLVVEGRDLLLGAWGLMVHEALAVREELSRAGIDAAVADLYSLPLDEAGFARLCSRNGWSKILTLEDNFAGGLGSAVRSALANRDGGVEVVDLCVRRLPKSGRTPQSVLEHVGLSRAHIVDAATRLHGAGV